MSQAFYRKWRPHLWDEVVSQEHVVQTLKNAIRAGRVGHAYLFAGPRGTGKTSTARLLAKAVNCLEEDLNKRPCDQCDHCKAVNEARFLDLIEIDAASNTSVEDVRSLRDKINFSPSQGRFKVYIIDEVHMLSTAAFNALLKTLEEPPAHAIFILATTEAHKIPATVLSRCQRHEFRRIPVDDIVRHLSQLAKQENIQIEPEALTLIARQSTGAMRDAISLLDQLASSGSTISLAQAQEVLGTATNQSVIELVDAILGGHTGAGLDCIHRALDGGTDSRQFSRQVVDYLRNLLLMRMGNADQVDATAELRAQMAQQAQAFPVHQLLGTIRLFNDAAADTRSGWQPGLQLELALAQAVSLPETPPAAPATVESTQETRSSVQRPPARTESAQPQPHVDSSAAGQPPVSPPDAPRRSANSAPITVNDLQQNWKRIRALVKQQSRPAEALLNSSTLLSIKDGVLMLGFQSEVLRAKMDTPDNIEIACQAIEDILGGQLALRCVVMKKRGASPADLDVDGDGVVGTALNLGGQIVQKD
jgi:DNA polymerase-3 subunit gamma/tau